MAGKRKVIIIGAGHVGSHVGYALAEQGVAEEIVLIDMDKEKAKAQALDIYDAVVYLPRRVIVRAGDYEEATDADLLVLAVGTNPDKSKGETRMDTLAATAEIVKEVSKDIKASGFHGIIVSISNPADVIAHYLQHLLEYPPNKIISTSTTLDSARFRRAIADAIGVDQKSIGGYTLGEHGESQVAVWSSVTVAGKPIQELIEEKPEKYGALSPQALTEAARNGGWQILVGKGSTEFGIGAALAEVARAIFFDEKRVLPVSTLLNGEYGQHDVYASVPTVLGADGVEEVIELHLSESEQEKFVASCRMMKENYEFALTL